MQDKNRTETWTQGHVAGLQQLNDEQQQNILLLGTLEDSKAIVR